MSSNAFELQEIIQQPASKKKYQDLARLLFSDDDGDLIDDRYLEFDATFLNEELKTAKKEKNEARIAGISQLLLTYLEYAHPKKKEWDTYLISTPLEDINSDDDLKTVEETLQASFNKMNAEAALANKPQISNARVYVTTAYVKPNVIEQNWLQRQGASLKKRFGSNERIEQAPEQPETPQNMYCFYIIRGKVQKYRLSEGIPRDDLLEKINTHTAEDLQEIIKSSIDNLDSNKLDQLQPLSAEKTELIESKAIGLINRKPLHEENPPLEEIQNKKNKSKIKEFFKRVLFGYLVFGGIANGATTTFLSIQNIIHKIMNPSSIIVDVVIGGLFILANVANFFNNEVSWLLKNLGLGSAKEILPTMNALRSLLKTNKLINTHIQNIDYSEELDDEMTEILKLSDNLHNHIIGKNIFKKKYEPNASDTWRFRIFVTMGCIMVGAGTFYSYSVMIAGGISLAALSTLTPIGAIWIAIGVTTALAFFINKQLSSPNKKLELFNLVKDKWNKFITTCTKCPSKIYNEKKKTYENKINPLFERNLDTAFVEEYEYPHKVAEASRAKANELIANGEEKDYEQTYEKIFRTNYVAQKKSFADCKKTLKESLPAYHEKAYRKNSVALIKQSLDEFLAKRPPFNPHPSEVDCEDKQILEDQKFDHDSTDSDSNPSFSPYHSSNTLNRIPSNNDFPPEHPPAPNEILLSPRQNSFLNRLVPAISTDLDAISMPVGFNPNY